MAFGSLNSRLGRCEQREVRCLSLSGCPLLAPAAAPAAAGWLMQGRCAWPPAYPLLSVFAATRLLMNDSSLLLSCRRLTKHHTPDTAGQLQLGSLHRQCCTAYLHKHCVSANACGFAGGEKLLIRLALLLSTQLPPSRRSPPTRHLPPAIQCPVPRLFNCW